MSQLLLLLAEAGFDITTIAPAISAVSSLGFAIWFAYHTTTTTLPNQAKDHREQINELDLRHSERIKEMSMVHADTIKALLSELKDARERLFDGRRYDSHP